MKNIIRNEFLGENFQNQKNRGSQYNILFKKFENWS